MTYTIGNSDETMSITPLATINNDDICVCTITPIINDAGLSAVLTFDGKTAPNSQTFTLAEINDSLALAGSGVTSTEYTVNVIFATYSRIYDLGTAIDSNTEQFYVTVSNPCVDPTITTI